MSKAETCFMSARDFEFKTVRKENSQREPKNKYGDKSEMEVKIDVNEETLSLITGYGKKDVTSIINEALAKWTNENMLKCPIDENFCLSNEPCNSCPKSKREMDLKTRKKPK